MSKDNSAGRIIDREARERVVSDLDSSLCVEAGAGTGKTTLLVDRYLSLVEKGRALPTQIVAITFTEKAAGEMKMRLREEIVSLLQSGDFSQEVKERLTRAQYELERAPISTIHAFCSSIIREYAVEAGVDPGFQILTGVEEEIYFQECWMDFLGMVDEPYHYFLEKFFARGGNIDKLMEITSQIYRHRGDRPLDEPLSGGTGAPVVEGGEEVDAWIRRLKEAGKRGNGIIDIDQFAREVKEARRHFRMLLENHCTNRNDRGAGEIRKFLNDSSEMDELKGDRLEEFLLSLKMPGSTRGNRKNWDPPAKCARFKEMARALKNIQAGHRMKFMDSLRLFIQGWSDKFADYIQKRKREDGLLDFDDLLIIAGRILEKGEILEVLRERYRYILVDEFQDTDPLQARIVLMLAGGPDRIEDKAPGKGRLFIVGDPKQSIYRFRKADIEIYQRVRRSLGSEGGTENIVQNFRSVPGIVEWVNSAFSDLMTGEEGLDFQPRYQDIFPFRRSSGSPVVYLDMEMDPEGAKSDRVRQVEAESISRFIHHLVREGWEIEDPETKAIRPVRYGDIAILYRGTTGVENYENTLRSEGIPYIVEGGKLFFTRQEIRDLANAMWVIEDPWDSLSLVSVLRSPLFGFSDEEIFISVRRYGKISYLEPGDERGKESTDLNEALNLLADLHRGRNVRGPAETLDRLLHRTGYIHFCCLRSHGDQIVLNIRKIIQRAKEFERRGNSFRSFARWFREQDEQEAAEGEFPMLDEGGNAIKMLTIHKSKGLQFPVVIVANLVQTLGPPPRIILKKGHGLSLKLGKEWKTGDYDKMADEEKVKDYAESVRLLYVAATRARDILVIPKSPSKKRSYFEMIAPSMEYNDSSGDSEDNPVERIRLSQLPSLKSTFNVFDRMPGSDDMEKPGFVRERERWMRERLKLTERAGTPPLVVNPSRVAGAAALELGGYSDHPDQDERMEEGRRAEIREGGSSLRLGSAFHSVMNRIDLERSRVEEITRSAAREFRIEHMQEELQHLVAGTLRSDIIRAASESEVCLREVPFTIKLEKGFLDGRIDLMFRLRGRWQVVDYKTDKVDRETMEEKRNRYKSQMCLYFTALRRMGFHPVSRLAIYFPRLDLSCDFEVSPRLLDEAERIIGKFSAPGTAG